MLLDLGIIWAIHSAGLNLPPKIYFSSGYRFWTLQHLKSNAKMSNSTTIRRNDGSEHIYSGQNAPLRRNWFEFFQKFSFVHSFFTYLTVIKNLTFFLSNFSPSTYSITIKMLLQWRISGVSRGKKKKRTTTNFRWFSHHPPRPCGVSFPSLPSLPFRCRCCRSLPCLALPCLALPCLALPCLALPCLIFPCFAVPCLA